MALTYEVFVLDDTWMDNDLIRNYLYGRKLLVYSKTDIYAVLVCADTINALAIIWNILAFLVLLQDDFRKRAINKYMACLCAVFLLDSTIRIVIDTIEIVDVSVLGAIPYLCSGLAEIQFVLQTLIAMLVTTISMERYIAIVHPLSRLTSVSSKTVVTVGWNSLIYPTCVATRKYIRSYLL